jgi:hypothetical protein
MRELICNEYHYFSAQALALSDNILTELFNIKLPQGVYSVVSSVELEVDRSATNGTYSITYSTLDQDGVQVGSSYGLYKSTATQGDYLVTNVIKKTITVPAEGSILKVYGYIYADGTVNNRFAEYLIVDIWREK